MAVIMRLPNFVIFAGSRCLPCHVPGFGAPAGQAFVARMLRNRRRARAGVSRPGGAGRSQGALVSRPSTIGQRNSARPAHAPAVGAGRLDLGGRRQRRDPTASSPPGSRPGNDPD